MKYKKGKKEVSSSLYSTLPETLETLHAKEASELQSEVKTHVPHTATRSNKHHPSIIHPSIPVPFHTWIIVSAPVCVQLKYKAALKKSLSSSLFHALPETLETAHAKEVSELLSEVTTGRRRNHNLLYNLLLLHEKCFCWLVDEAQHFCVFFR